MTSTVKGVRTSADRQAERESGVRRALRNDPVLRRAAFAGAAWVVAFAVLTVMVSDSDTGRRWLGNVVYLVPIVLAVGLCAVAAARAVGRMRAFWVVLTASNVLWLGGELVWSAYEFATPDGPPFPSLADGFYLTSYALVVPAVVLGFGARWLRVSRSMLDASVIAAALGLLGWQLVIEPQLAWGASAATAVGVAYPLLGIVILVVVSVLGYGGHRQVPLSVGLVAAAFAVTAVTDVLYTHAVVLHEYASGGWHNVGWQLEAVLLCLAGLAAATHAEGAARPDALRRDATLPLLLAGALLTTVVTAYDARTGSVSAAAGALALLTLGAVVARLTLTVREKDQVAQALQQALVEQERLAITDGLTGLHNRRFAEEMLRIEAERCARTHRPLSVVVADGDLFKRINDRYGHAVGDAVLREIAARLVASARPSDVVARYGGEEFVILLPEVGSEAAAEIAERCRRAMSDVPVEVDGVRLRVTLSLGVASMPEHADDVDELLRVADACLYLAKDAGRDRVQVGPGVALGAAGEEGVPSEAVELLCTLADRADGDGCAADGPAVARWSAAVAAALGLDAPSQRRAFWAGRLHDIGKMQVPDPVLHKDGPLDQQEWALVRQHARQGGELIRMVPRMEDVAAVVDQHHERVDGAGYPRGLRGPQILLEARIVAVCDGWAAMRAPRQGAAKSVPEARATLLAGAGTQWDVNVVECFLRLLTAGSVGELTGALDLQPVRVGS